MIIGIDASRLSEEQKTGVEGYALFLLRAMIALEKNSPSPADVEYRLYARQPIAHLIPPLPHSWSIRILRSPFNRLWTQGRLSLEMFMKPVDVLFIPAHVFPFFHPKKTVMMIHDIAAAETDESYSRFERWYALFITRWAMRSLWCILVPSHATKQQLNTFFVQDTDSRQKTIVIPHGYNRAYGESIPEQTCLNILGRYGITRPYLLSLGRLETKKNTVRLIEAFDIFRSQNPHSSHMLVLAGKPGHGYPDILRAFRRSPFQKDIAVLGWVPDADSIALMQEARVFLFPSRSEGFGLPLLEAFAAGTPVVASAIPALQEIGGDAALFVDPDSSFDIARAMDCSINDETLRQKMIAEGLKQLAHFSWNKTAEETRRVLLTGRR